jgi:hypothetical protein
MPKATVQLGSHGDDVKRVQRYFIRARQMDPTHLDSDFGPETDSSSEISNRRTAWSSTASSVR